MPIRVKCEGCGKLYRVKDELSGKQLKCPNCDATLTVAPAPSSPAPTPPPNVPTADELREELEIIEQQRKRNALLSFAFGLPGLALPFLPFWPSSTEAFILVWAGSMALLGVGFGFAAKYKGRDTAWALVALFVCAGVLILAVLKDYNAEKIAEIKAALRLKGESV